ncbi:MULTISPECIES: hypothetical protein [unclassified Polaribacter]|jgi:hypothetical protein|uniref:hypothetical protein n=1 Tax=unclassified Polaribacter TaxID=196858 RepID=UPI00055F0630|nr:MULTISPECIES: hypothetical protein [unclassified Polaribacter]MDG2276148.1 hypothetical protein [Flavobacteriaceae bacterium]MBT4412818.1 hypothetical protein [Polaribacter sp.]MDG1194903.1 hypothetical protein [Polaribacter sp.]MDG1403380.1 hypothetical protein [Polaribacter sp.]PKV64776.1 hypothetical protein ATE90_1176 [Polaribacter sp. Hel1_33_96]
MSDFKHLFNILEHSIASNKFVKLTLSKPLRKSEGLLNVYVRLFVVDKKEVFQLKYRYPTEEKYQQFSLEDVKTELEKLLIVSFRAGTLFTLSEDLLVMVSKKKAVSYRENSPSFKNKLPEILLKSK